jgi:hypothetical protein
MRLILLSILLAGCSGNAQPDPEMTGCATDENWRTFDDQEPTGSVSDDNSPKFTFPAAGMTVPFAMPPIVTWTQDANNAGAPDGDVPHGPTDACTFNPGALTTLHLPPISGDVFDLQFNVGGHLDHRVVTTLQEWTPPNNAQFGDVWTRWKGQTVTVKIWRMTVLKNDPKQGPFTPSMTFSFSVGS